MRRLVVLLLRAYRHGLGAILPDACRFTPSCSRYAEEAVLTRGLIVGTGLTIWRLLRCHPFGRGGYDPVPAGKRRTPPPE